MYQGVRYSESPLYTIHHLTNEHMQHNVINFFNTGLDVLYNYIYILIHPCILGNRGVITKILTSPRQL